MLLSPYHAGGQRPPAQVLRNSLSGHSRLAVISASWLVFSKVAPPVTRVPSKGSLALILPTSWAPSAHKAADGHAFRRHLWSALFARRLSQTADMVASGGSDSSAQVLRNSRPEFRPPDASTYGFITEMLTTRASGVGAPEII